MLEERETAYATGVLLATFERLDREGKQTQTSVKTNRKAGWGPKWIHGKRAIVEPARLLTARELRQRVCDYFGCEQTELLGQQISS
ncbi:hypothetical protein [Ktedonobacter robiniae]|uniref:Uncharacterized protein n=1 Tax=Ktedonobacter robiniae TaxID=2778365 RepID=A0ABQ3UZD3_9CHLR|nr:hypothetical protein [Ktedonobacter robiniae]GHO57902.1 hypothetical protein KSB_63770 [Ktedonobacter robiniae]